MHRSCDGTLRNKVSGKFHGDTVRYYCCSNRIEKSLERISQVVIVFFFANYFPYFRYSFPFMTFNQKIGE